jgi:hypothetical protein
MFKFNFFNQEKQPQKPEIEPKQDDVVPQGVEPKLFWHLVQRLAYDQGETGNLYSSKSAHNIRGALADQTNEQGEYTSFIQSTIQEAQEIFANPQHPKASVLRGILSQESKTAEAMQSKRTMLEKAYGTKFDPDQKKVILNPKDEDEQELGGTTLD